jgi:hypothetical protein
MGLFLLLVWIPKMAEGSMTAFQWGEAVVTWALTSADWVMTDSYRSTPWLGRGGDTTVLKRVYYSSET